MVSTPVIGLFVGLILGLAWGGVGDFGAFALTAFIGIIGYVVGKALESGVAEDLNQYLNRGRRP